MAVGIRNSLYNYKRFLRIEQNETVNKLLISERLEEL